MKKLFILLGIVAMIGVGGLAIADDCDPNNGYVSTTSSFPFSFNHDHNIYRPPVRNPVGVGLDLIVYESDTILEDIAIETKYDWQNDESSVYAVARVNVFKAVKGLFK